MASASPALNAATHSDVYFRITGRKYDGLMGQYRKQTEDRESP